MTTYTKMIIEKNQKEILSAFSGRNKKKQFYDEVTRLMKHFRTDVYHTIMLMADGGMFRIYYPEITDYLVSLGLKDRKRLEKTDVWSLYKHLLARDGTKLYEKIRKEMKG